MNHERNTPSTEGVLRHHVGMALKIGLAAILSTPSAASAQGSGGTCAELRSIVAAGNARPPFPSFPREAFQPALGFAGCAVTEIVRSYAAFVCIEDDDDSLGRWQRLTEQVVTCFPDAVRLPNPLRPPDRGDDHDANFQVGGVEISISEAGYGNSPGRYVAIQFEARTDL